MRIAYLDCFSGISGDMFLGALLAAGVSEQLLHDTVQALNAAGALDARLEIHPTQRSGVSATKVDVWVGGEKDSPRTSAGAVVHNYSGARSDSHPRSDSDSHSHSHSHSHDGEDSHQHGHAEQHQHHSSGGAGAHRGLKEIRAIIQKASIPPGAKTTAIAIFEALGAAEAKVHNINIEQIHFHEVGAADAIVDIVCAAVGSHALGVGQWVCSALNVGSGSVECAHGRFPVPAPATLELLRGAPIFSSGIEAELVTPTGAAIVHNLVSRFVPLPRMKIDAVGYGAGARDFPGHANVLRLLLGEEQESTGLSSDLESIASRETITVLQASLDDLNPQVFGYVLERLLAEGALDAFSAPLQMKKGRPGTLLTVLARPADASRLAKLIFSETSTLGVRMREESRMALLRRQVSVRTPWGDVHMKVASMNGSVAHYAPEYEDCRRIAAQRQVPLKQVMQEAIRAYQSAEKI
jgi:uncharacterized protein (TIGR00299 family) protein